VWQNIFLSLVKNGERRDNGIQRKQERFVGNENPSAGGDLNRGFYMESRFKKDFCFQYMSIYCQNKENKFMTSVKLDILQFNIVTKHKYIIYVCVLYYIINTSKLLAFRPTPMYSRNYHNDAQCATKINYVLVSD
jgi:hypothetical protein